VEAKWLGPRDVMADMARLSGFPQLPPASNARDTSSVHLCAPMPYDHLLCVQGDHVYADHDVDQLGDVCSRCGDQLLIAPTRETRRSTAADCTPRLHRAVARARLKWILTRHRALR
jgi:hypothetical protein